MSDVILEVPGASTGQLAGRKRRRNRWSDAPPTDSPGEVLDSVRRDYWLRVVARGH